MGLIAQDKNRQMMMATILCLLALTATTAASLSDTNQTASTDVISLKDSPAFLRNSKHHNHPRVRGSANQVTLQFKENSFYRGDLYVGSEFAHTYVLFDTRTKWTGVVAAGAEGAGVVSSYDLQDSTTKVGVNRDDAGEPEAKSLSLDSTRFDGDLYREQMCLYQVGEGRTLATGSLCAKH